MKIVLDTNVLVSGIFWGGVPEKILELAISGDVEIYATEEILNEYRIKITEVERLLNGYISFLDK